MKSYTVDSSFWLACDSCRRATWLEDTPDEHTNVHATDTCLPWSPVVAAGNNWWQTWAAVASVCLWKTRPLSRTSWSLGDQRCRHLTNIFSTFTKPFTVENINYNLVNEWFFLAKNYVNHHHLSMPQYVLMYKQCIIQISYFKVEKCKTLLQQL